MQNNALMLATERLVDWLTNDSMPLWIEHGVDPVTGCCFDQITGSHRPVISNDHRLRLHAQQAYVMTRCESRGWARGLHGLVKQMSGFVSRRGTLPCRSDGYVHSLDARLAIRSGEHSVADHAFFIMSSAATFAAFGDGSEQRRAVNILKWLDRRFAHPNGGWYEGTQMLDYRRQATHMYMLQAFLFLYEITRRDRWLARAKDLYQLVSQNLINESEGIIYENYTADWQPQPSERNWIVPAHLFNWVWLLQRLDRFAGTDVTVLAHRLFDTACQRGRDPETGLYYRRTKPDGSVTDKHLPLEAQAQLIKACLALAELEQTDRRGEWEVHAADAIEGLFRHFLSPAPAGLWHDSASEAADSAPNASASNLFYVVDAAIAAKDYLKRVADRSSQKPQPAA